MKIKVIPRPQTKFKISSKIFLPCFLRLEINPLSVQTISEPLNPLK